MTDNAANRRSRELLKVKAEEGEDEVGCDDGKEAGKLDG